MSETTVPHCVGLMNGNLRYSLPVCLLISPYQRVLHTRLFKGSNVWKAQTVRSSLFATLYSQEDNWVYLKDRNIVLIAVKFPLLIKGQADLYFFTHCNWALQSTLLDKKHLHSVTCFNVWKWMHLSHFARG